MSGANQGEIQICNRAIGKVGGTRIVSFLDETREANICADQYAALRDEVLTAADWSFARVRHQVNPLADPPVSGYNLAYPVPAGVLKVWNVYQNARLDVELTHWDIESLEDDTTVIVANPAGNQPSIWTRSTRRVTNTARFSPLFASALVARLAIELAVPIAQSRQIKRDYEVEFRAMLTDATSSDGQQGRTKATYAPTILRVRGRGGQGPWVYGPAVPGA